MYVLRPVFVSLLRLKEHCCSCYTSRQDKTRQDGTRWDEKKHEKMTNNTTRKDTARHNSTGQDKISIAKYNHNYKYEELQFELIVMIMIVIMILKDIHFSIVILASSITMLDAKYIVIFLPDVTFIYIHPSRCTIFCYCPMTTLPLTIFSIMFNLTPLPRRAGMRYV